MSENKITLIEFSVEKNRRWESKEEGYTCKARYSAKNMDFTVKLPNELGNLLLEICKGEIAKNTSKALDLLRIDLETLEEK